MNGFPVAGAGDGIMRQIGPGARCVIRSDVPHGCACLEPGNTIAGSSPATRSPDSDGSAISARHSRLNASRIASSGFDISAFPELMGAFQD